MTKWIQIQVTKWIFFDKKPEEFDKKSSKKQEQIPFKPFQKLEEFDAPPSVRSSVLPPLVSEGHHLVSDGHHHLSQSFSVNFCISSTAGGLVNSAGVPQLQVQEGNVQCPAPLVKYVAFIDTWPVRSVMAAGTWDKSEVDRCGSSGI